MENLQGSAKREVLLLRRRDEARQAVKVAATFTGEGFKLVGGALAELSGAVLGLAIGEAEYRAQVIAHDAKRSIRSARELASGVSGFVARRLERSQ